MNGQIMGTLSDGTIIRRMTLADAENVWRIESATFPMPWSLRDFEHEMTENACARYLVAERAEGLVGFAGAHIILDEGHITNIAVTEDCRGQGVGRALTGALLQYAANLGARYVTLEVRADNEPAKALYHSFGFVKVGVRKRYYEDQQDAWIMVTDHMPAADPDFEEAETLREDPAGEE